MQDDVIRVARLICNQMQDDDDCACTSACGASIYAARAAMAATREIDAEALRERQHYIDDRQSKLPGSYNEGASDKAFVVADWLQQRAKEQADA